MAHVGEDGELGALALETPGCSLGSILVHSATLLDSRWDQRAQGLTSVEGNEKNISKKYGYLLMYVPVD